MRSPHDHVHRLAPGAKPGEELLGDRHQLGLRAPRLVGRVHGPEAGLVDRHALAHERELLLALDRARDVEGDLEVQQLERALRERAVVAHGHHVVEAVDGEPADALRAQVVADPGPGMLGEDRVRDPAVGMVADPARLAGEDRDRVAVRRQQHVGVAVHDAKAREVADRALEAGVLAAADEQRVGIVLGHRGAGVGVAARDLVALGVRAGSVMRPPVVRSTSARCPRPAR